MSHSLSLESVAKQFASWREASHRERQTPQSLKQQAVALKSDYPVSQIISALGINHRNLKRWSILSERDEPSAFVSLPALLPKDKSIAPQLLATCEFPNGIQLQLTTDILKTDLLSQIYRLKPEDKS